MQFQVKTGSREPAADGLRHRSDLSPAGNSRPRRRSLDAAGGGLITRGDPQSGHQGRGRRQLLLLLTRHGGGLPCQRILLVGLGNQGQARPPGLAQGNACRAGQRWLAGQVPARPLCYLTAEAVSDADAYRRAQTGGGDLARGQLPVYRHEVRAGRQAARRSTGLGHRQQPPATSARHSRASPTARPSAGPWPLAKDLGNLPPNVCTPSYLVRPGARHWPSRRRS